MRAGNKTNGNLHNAKRQKNDEHYTRQEDIGKEMSFYSPDIFKGQVVYNPCDDATKSEIWKYFRRNFNRLGLKKLISTHLPLDSYKRGSKVETDGTTITQVYLWWDNRFRSGDFRSKDCEAIFEESDIIVTSPPFSCVEDLVQLLFKHNKLFLINAPISLLTYKSMRDLINEKKMWFGCTRPTAFTQPDGKEKPFGNIYWFTNLPHGQQVGFLPLTKCYNSYLYPKYINCDAIEVSEVENIPMDYEGVMGVPITFLAKFNPDQFEIVGYRKGDNGKDLRLPDRYPYYRLLIRNRNPLVSNKSKTRVSVWSKERLAWLFLQVTKHFGPYSKDAWDQMPEGCPHGSVRNTFRSIYSDFCNEFCSDGLRLPESEQSLMMQVKLVTTKTFLTQGQYATQRKNRPIAQQAGFIKKADIRRLEQHK